MSAQTPDAQAPISATPTSPTSSAALRAIRLESAASALLAHDTLSRTELAQATGYSAASMTATIRDLTALGLVETVGLEKSTGGRRRTKLRFNRSSVRFTLLAISDSHLTVSQTDLAGVTYVQIRRQISAQAPLESISEAVQALHQTIDTPSRCVVVSMPGVVSLTGDVSLAPALGQELSANLQEMIAQVVDLPVLIENDVNLLALGEYAAGAAKGVSDFVLVYIGAGIGGALVLEGNVYRGSTQSAGEIGFLPWGNPLALSDQPQPEKAAVGPFESEWGISGLMEKASRIGLESTDESLIGDLENSNESGAVELLQHTLQAWAYSAIVNACVVNPESIVFAGATEGLSEKSRTTLAQLVTKNSPSPPRIQFSTLGETAIQQGAIAYVTSRASLILENAITQEEA